MIEAFLMLPSDRNNDDADLDDDDNQNQGGFKCALNILVLRKIVFVPNQSQLNFTQSEHFDKNRNVCQIINCFECFMETPKSLYLQKLTCQNTSTTTPSEFWALYVNRLSQTFISGSKTVTPRWMEKCCLVPVTQLSEIGLESRVKTFWLHHLSTLSIYSLTTM